MANWIIWITVVTFRIVMNESVLSGGGEVRGGKLLDVGEGSASEEYVAGDFVEQWETKDGAA